MAGVKLTAETLRGIWAGITLSWDEQYGFDEAPLRANLRRLCAAKVHGIYTTGSTGEFYALDFDEFRRLVDIMVEEVRPSGLPTMIGCVAPDTRGTLRLIEYVCKAGCDGAQVAMPYWMALTDRELAQFYRDLHSASDPLPLMHYNVPRAKRFLLADDYERLLEAAPSLIGVKFTFAGNHFDDLQAAILRLPQMSFFVGENLLASAMQLGARGSCSSIVCLGPEFMLKMFALAEQRQWDEALGMQHRLVRFSKGIMELLSGSDEVWIDPVVDKALAVASGYLVGHQRTRPPYIGWSDETVKKVRGWLVENYPEFVAD